MTTDKRTLFVSFEAGKWTGEQLERLMEKLGEVTPDDVEVIAATDDVEYLTRDEALSFGRSIVERLADDD